MNSRLVLLRHGQSEWNRENRFTGWHDSPLSDQGFEEARKAGRLLAEANLIPQKIHTSMLSRATQTTSEALAELSAKTEQDLTGIPINKTWRLNERHYGDLTGLNKKEAVRDFGADQVFAWRRKYDVQPPEITSQNPYAKGIESNHPNLDPELLPKTECLANVLERLLPYWESDIVPDIEEYEVVLISAHGNSLRALVKFLDGITDEEISELNIPTGIPLIYELVRGDGGVLQPRENIPIQKRYLGGLEDLEKATKQVADQTRLKN